ncbi:hypothetical protein D3C84_175150 [compost metagenome]
MFGIAGEQRIPLRAPQDFDHVPAGTGEQRFQFLDDLAVTAHRAVEALQVAVDDEGQVVQLLPGGQGQAGDGFRLVHLAIAEHAPDVAPIGLLQASVLQIAHEPRLVHRADGADAHGPGGELPEVRHQPRMRVGAQAGAVDFLAVVGQLLFTQASFEKRPGIHPGRRVWLEEHQVGIALAVVAIPAKKMLESHLEDFRRRRVTGDMSTQFAVGLVGANHHGQGVPAQ